MIKSKLINGTIMVSSLIVAISFFLAYGPATAQHSTKQFQRIVYQGPYEAINTACNATLSAFDAATDATSSLACANTGTLTIDGWAQISVDIVYNRSAGTDVKMQCDRQLSPNTGYTYWVPIMDEDSTGEKDIRTWTSTQSVSGAISHDFGVVAYKLRCRYWATSGDGSDLALVIVKASKIGG